MVDGRFVLKVTDYGYGELLDAQRAPRPHPAPEGQLRGDQGCRCGRGLYLNGVLEGGLENSCVLA